MTVRRVRPATAVLFALLLVLAVGGHPPTVGATPTTYYANKTADDTGADPGDCANSTNTDCSLRAAVELANTTSGVTIDIPAGSYTLDHAVISEPSGLVLAAPMTLTGAGAGNTIIQANANPNTANYGVLLILGTSDSNVTISGVTIRHGVLDGSDFQPGGGLQIVGGNVLIEDSTISDNAVNATDGSAQGGGISVFGGDVQLLRTTVRDNTVNAAGTGSQASGAGIATSGGTLTVVNSTISGNVTNGDGVPASGAGIYSSGTLSVVNSTLTGNVANATNGVATGGAIMNLAQASITNSTITGNRLAGGIVSSGTAIYSAISPVTLTNDLIADAAGGELYGTFLGNNNLVDDSSISKLSGTGNVNQPALIGTLGNYSGPTQTIPLLPGSPAIDAGDETTCTATGDTAVNNLDQRGLTRSHGDHCDIGAFESGGFTLVAGTGSTPQSTFENTDFATALTVNVIANEPVEPVNGGVISFAAPITGASASFSAATATIASNQASVTATANGTTGDYAVTASASGASPITFELTNVEPPDTIAPTTTANAVLAGTSTTYPFGSWTNQSVTVTLSATDETAATDDIESGVAHTYYTLDSSDQQTYTGDISIDTEGDHTLTFWSVDNANNIEDAHTVHVMVDKTPPTITFTGNQGTYTVDQTVNIHCTPNDALSGIASTTCADITGSAASFGVGTHTSSATATDNAGNTTTVVTTFTVSVTVNSLCTLTGQYTGNSRTTSQLCAPLQLVQLAERAHNSRMKTAAINSYILLLNSQRGRGLTTQEVATLTQLARAL